MTNHKGPDTQSRGIPTTRYVDHAGYTVPDLEEAVSFFVDVLGCDLLYRAGPYEDPDGDYMREGLTVHPRASVVLAVLRCGPATNVELVEFASPDRDPTPPKPSDAGGRHLAFWVDDMDAAVEYLRVQPGVRLLAPLKRGEEDGTEESGMWCTYFVTPWGMYMELVKRPERMRYEGETKARLFRTEASWDRR